MSRVENAQCELSIGVLIVVSTVVLGIHWLTDVVAGLATGILALAAALRVVDRVAWMRASGGSGRPATTRSRIPVGSGPA